MWQMSLHVTCRKQLIQRLNRIIAVSSVLLLALWFMSCTVISTSDIGPGSNFIWKRTAVFAILMVTCKLGCLCTILTILLAFFITMQLQSHFKSVNDSKPKKFTKLMAGRLARVHTLTSWFFLLSFAFAGVVLVLQAGAFESEIAFMNIAIALHLAFLLCVMMYIYLFHCKERFDSEGKTGQIQTF